MATEIKRHYQPNKTTTVNKTVIVKQPLTSLFTKDNYTWMAIGAAVVVLGMILMAGGKNTDPNNFDYNLVYSTQRITVAPILILLGLMIEIYAIFKKPKVKSV